MRVVFLLLFVLRSFSVGGLTKELGDVSCSAYLLNNTKHIDYNAVACNLGTVQFTPTCTCWNIVAAMLFSDSAFTSGRLNDSITYIKKAGSYCHGNSQLKLVTPTSTTSNPASTSWGAASDLLLDSLTPALVTQNNTNENSIIYMMQNVVSATASHKLDDGETGVVYLFTDFLCSSLVNTLNAFMGQLTTILHNGYSLRILLANATDISSCNQTLVCLNCTYPQCGVRILAGNANIETNCLKSAPAPGDFGSTPKTQGTPPPQGTPSPKPVGTTGSGPVVQIPPFTTLELVLMIGIPCLSLVACCGICACCCLKCTKLRHRAMERVGWKNKKGKKELCVEEFGKSPNAPNLDNFAAANHYMDIQQLAVRNKKDYWELPPKNLIIHDAEILGTGAFANVFRGTLTGKIPLLKAQTGITLNIENQKDGSCETAVKRLPAHADEQNRMDFFHEIDFMKRLGYHVHIIAMLGCVSDPWDPLILVEYCHYGDMLKFLRNHRPYLLMAKEEVCPIEADMCLRIKDLVSFAWQISDGLSYLSSKNFIHRDVAARNVLLTKNLVAKVSDFGLCRYIDSALYTAKGGKLPIKWMAIESLKFYEYSFKSDVWAYGVCLFEIFSMGDGPYQAIQPLEMLKHLENGSRLDRPDKCPHEIYSLMLRCWKEDAQLRPSFNEIRCELTAMLNLDDEHYGYLSVESNNMPQYRTFQEIVPIVEKMDVPQPPALPPKSPTTKGPAPPPPIPEKPNKKNETEEKRKQKELNEEKKNQQKTLPPSPPHTPQPDVANDDNFERLEMVREGCIGSEDEVLEALHKASLQMDRRIVRKMAVTERL